MVEYNQSIYYDRALFAQDIAGSIAWARANRKAGILSATELSTIEAGLCEVEKEWKDGRFEIRPGIDEDIHTANERRLSEIGTNTLYSETSFVFNAEQWVRRLVGSYTQVWIGMRLSITDLMASRTK